MIKKRHILLGAVLFVLMWVLFLSGRTTIKKYVMPELSNNVDFVLENEARNEKEYNFYQLDTNLGDIKSLEVLFKGNCDKKQIIKLYYASKNNNYNEIDTREGLINAGTDRVVFSVSELKSEKIAIVTPFDSIISEIRVSSENAKIEIVKKSNLKISEFLIFSILISCLGSIVLNQIFCNKNIKELFSKNNIIKYLKKIMLVIGVSFVLTIILQLVSKVFFTRRLIYIEDGHIELNFYWLLYIFMFSVFALGIWWFRKDWAKKPEKIYAIIAMTVGIVISVEMPMLSERAPDAAIHYQNAQALSSAFEDEYNYMDVGHLFFSYNANELDRIVEKYDYEYITSTTVNNSFSFIRAYSYIGYIPSAIGLFLAKGLHLSLNSMIWMGRFFNLFAFVIIMYYAIKNLKAGKNILIIIGLFPTVIMLASNYSYDAWTLAFLMLGLSYYSRMITENDYLIKTKDYVIMFLSLFLSLGSKAAYFPLIFLTIFVPKKCFENKEIRKKYYITFAILVLLVLFFAALPTFIQSGGVMEGISSYTDTRGGYENINPIEQLKYILSNPGNFLKTLFGFLKIYWSYSKISEFTVFMFYLGTMPLQWLLMLLLVFSIVTDSTDGQVYHCKVVNRFLGIAATFGMSAILATVFYLLYTPVGWNGIGGCQERYILPALFTGLLAFRCNFLDLKVKRGYYNIFICLTSAFIIWFGTLLIVTKPYFI